ncbi:MAG: DNA mismatch endonuclease Vsr [Synechococcus sp. SB0662_bin_45]|nr:DNA mismatch endonuclease Vsr [Synechococcus sp. SB0668_bin_13]MYE20905.1 DNA mismatch endonuclease Vsr [Synechococcus sp. SB0662_bin_45]
MVDNLTPEVRSRIMASVAQKNTGPEMYVRRLLHRMGYRYALHRRDLPGRPDLVFRPRRKVVFVHGCFWHGHTCRRGRLPTSRADYWAERIATNQARDMRNVHDLEAAGWDVCVVWECEISDPDLLRQRLVRFLDSEPLILS